MNNKKNISLIYQYNDKWIGGTYYILNIVKALARLPNDSRPNLTIYHDLFTPLDDLHVVNYPGVKYVAFNSKKNIVFKLANKIARRLVGKALFTIKLPGAHVENFYYRNFEFSATNINRYYFWISDLQALCLPDFFKKQELKNQAVLHSRMIKENVPIVFSSQSALNDYNRFYPANKNDKRVLSFVSLHDANPAPISIVDLKEKFNISSDYFIVSNQFWKHKNHLMVLQAFNELFKLHKNFQLVLTGKEHDYRNPNYTNELKEFVVQNGLTQKILFLGFISRAEQIELLRHSEAIIQPSLFEGWSTIVEDAKLLNKHIVCSDIPVHHEQLPESDLFFNPHDVTSLISAVERVINKDNLYDASYDHDKAVIAFANNFIQLFD